MVKQLWVLAGGNGSGKSTFFNTRLKRKEIIFVNADLIAKEKFPEKTLEASKQAQSEARRMCTDYLEQGVSFCFETVFSHDSKIELIQKAKQLKFEINLVYIHLDSEELNVARVLQRVSEGGHSVPEEKIRARIPRTHEHMKTAFNIADNALILDNSDPDNPFKIICKKNGEIIEFLSEDIPNWVIEIIQQEDEKKTT